MALNLGGGTFINTTGYKTINIVFANALMMGNTQENHYLIKN
jgi:hypothetical protein